MPAGLSVPADQTVEGGTQIRVTPTGFSKITDLIPAVLNDTFADGFCLPSDSQGILIGDIDWCYQNDGSCAPGCQADFLVDSIDVSVVGNVLNIRAQFDIDVDVPIRFDPIIGGNSSCNMDATAANNVINADINFGINAATGELEIGLDDISDLDINLNINGCGLVGDILDVVADAIFGILSVDFIRDLIQPLLEDLVQGFLPDPLGLVGMLDGGSLLPGVAPETNASVELRFVAGGYVFLEGAGMSLGMISGINADEDQSTRSTDLDSEPALCVPPIPSPDFAAPPASLSTSPRGNFNLLPAGAFRGLPDPTGTDLIIGASETTLDQLGHHLVTSGGFCLGLGTELVEQLNLGTFGLLVPSLAELGEDDDPMLLVTRPQTAIDFSVGDGTATDPSLTIGIKNFEIDFYAFIFDRYTRAFTLSLTADAGLNLEFTVDANGVPSIIPMLVGLDAASLGLTVHNSEFIREPAADLEAILPALLDALLPQLTSGLPPVALPEFAGFALTNLSVNKVTTPEDDFLAIGAELGASQSLIDLGSRFPSVAKMVGKLPADGGGVASRGRASLREVVAPTPQVIRAGIAASDRQRLPGVEIDVDSHDQLGRPLEWSWNINGGLWRPFQTGSPIAIREQAFVLQGEYEIQLMSRAIGDYTTTSQELIKIPVVIDSAPPRIYAEKIERAGVSVIIPVTDLVSDDDAIEIAFGPAGASEPSTGWAPQQTLSVAVAKDLVSQTDGTSVEIFARDERGNISSEEVELGDVIQFHGAGDGGGCQCDASGASAGSIFGSLAILAMTLLLLAGPARRRKLGRVLSTIVGIGLLSNIAACSCGSSEGEPLECPEGDVITCFDEAMEDCTCTADIPYGNIGQYSEMAVAPDGSYWVSAYNSEHGDLMVANVTSAGRIPDETWEFVDGVPDGPSIPGLTIRGGVRDAGPDVGLYTDIGVSASGRVLVSYFSNEDGGLYAAVGDGGVWSKHVVDAGLLGEIETGFEVVGQYSAIGFRAADERPVIAYFVSVGEAGERRTELRLARSSTANPASTGDWTVEVIESTPVAETEDSNILTIPRGSGLFVNLVMRSDDEPVLAYYDRINGDLKLAQMVDGAFVVETLDGVDVDVGWYPGIAIDSSDVVHVSYVSASSDDLLYINTLDRVVELVDSGYRIVGTTEDGLPKPEFHFVGDDSSVVLTGAGPIIIYQDATTHELLAAGKEGSGTWLYQPIAGNEDPFVGGYGFYASAAADGPRVAMSTYVVDQPNTDAWVEVFVQQVAFE